MSLARRRTMFLLGEGEELFEEDLPSVLDGKTLAQTGIRANTGLDEVAGGGTASCKPAPFAGEVPPAGPACS